MSKIIFCDDRWKGQHGIGRYATEVLNRIPNNQDLRMTGKPTSPLDPLALTLTLKAKRAKIFYNPGFNAPLNWDGISLLTIHDLIHLDDPSQSTFSKRMYYQFVLKPALLKAPFIFTVSKKSQTRLTDWLGISNERILVTPNGVSPEFRISGDTKDNYFVYVGTSRSHKNTIRMLQAFSQIQDKDVMLKWVGEISKSDLDLIQSLDLNLRVQNLQGLSDSKLAEVYSKAKGTILISTIEGFGLPPLESIFCGTPALIASNNPITEELGSLAITTNPYDLDDIIDKMNVLSRTECYSNADQERIQKLQKIFSWDETAAIVSRAISSL